MPQTMAQKLLARAIGRDQVRVGEIVECVVDRILIHEGIGWGIADVIKQMGVTKLGVPEKIVALFDHYAPPATEATANFHALCRKFVADFEIREFLDMRKGICHQVMVEDYVNPGEIIVACDSHTTTYGALGSFATGFGSTDTALAMVEGKTWFKVPETIRIVFEGALAPLVTAKDVVLELLGILKADGAGYASCEFTGPGVRSLTMADRFCIANLCAEMGAKVALMPLDERTTDFLAAAGRPMKSDVISSGDPGAECKREVRVNLSPLTPRVAKPHSPDNVCSIAEAGEVAVDQVFIGSCSNGRIEDMRAAAAILKGRVPNPKVRIIVIPASHRIMKQMAAEGILEVLLDAGAVVGPPSCGPCFGGSFGLLAAGEVCVSTSTRNFLGRMGSKQAKVYMASPETAAASAITGRLTDPRTLS